MTNKSPSESEVMMEKNMITQSALNIWNLVTYYLSPEAGKPHNDKPPWEREAYGDVPRVPEAMNEENDIR